MSSEQIVTCPHCAKDVDLAYVATVPKEQRCSLTLTSSESRWLPAESVGNMILAQSEVLCDVAEELGRKVVVFVDDVRVSEGKVCVDFMVMEAERE